MPAFLLQTFSIMLLLLAVGCTSRVEEGAENLLSGEVESKVTMESSIEVLDDESIKSRGVPTCSPKRGLKLVVASNPDQPLFCRDLTALNPQLSLGLACPGGVTIQSFTSSQQWVRCDQLKVCGVTANETIELVSRGNTRVRQLHFANLPWGCVGEIEVSRSMTLQDPAKGELNLSIDTTPASCPNCVAAGGPSCAACADDKTPPTITEVAVDGSICLKVKFAVFASDAETALHPLPYSFDGGTTWQASNEFEVAGTGANLPASRVKVRDISGNIATFTQNRSGSTQSACACQHGSLRIENGSTQTVYAEATPACNQVCRSGKVTCTDGRLNGDTTMMASSCTASTCGCTTPGGQKIAQGETMLLYKTKSVACGQGAACNTSDNRIRVRCTNVATNQMDIVEGSGQLSQFRQSSCGAAACGCRHLGVEFKPTDPPLTVYRFAEAVAPILCSSPGNFGQVRCKAQGSGFTAEGDLDTKTYPHTACVNTGRSNGDGAGNSDYTVGAGTGGGTGGGLGNDSGEGEGFRRRSGGGPGGGAPCEVNKPPYFCFGAIAEVETPSSFCFLPRTDGYVSVDATKLAQRVTPGGFIPAFSKATTACADSCTNHMSFVRCDSGAMSGKTQFPYLDCREVCP